MSPTASDTSASTGLSVRGLARTRLACSLYDAAWGSLLVRRTSPAAAPAT